MTCGAHLLVFYFFIFLPPPISFVPDRSPPHGRASCLLYDSGGGTPCGHGARAHPRGHSGGAGRADPCDGSDNAFSPPPLSWITCHRRRCLTRLLPVLFFSNRTLPVRSPTSSPTLATPMSPYLFFNFGKPPLVFFPILLMRARHSSHRGCPSPLDFWVRGKPASWANIHMWDVLAPGGLPIKHCSSQSRPIPVPAHPRIQTLP
jgi:hypothetical protein